ncbi:MAG: superoxide dismutase [Bergeyella zoohelcum]|nr:superoxide dismutase [Bergeyella zoohelcum]
MKLIKIPLLVLGTLSATSCVVAVGNSSQKPAVETTISIMESFGSPTDVKVEEGAFPIVPLAYDYGALEGNIDTKTMYIHFSKHYVGYLNNLNKAVKDQPQAKMSIENLLKNLDLNDKTLRNNAGGYYNHNLYFSVMSPKGGGQPTGELLNAINKNFGSFEAFKEIFSNASAKQFGSGWAWLVVDNNGNLKVGTTANQDNPLMPNMEISGTPILGIDVWEHAYYLQYQNKRTDYISNFWNVINWDKVAEYYSKAKK